MATKLERFFVSDLPDRSMAVGAAERRPLADFLNALEELFRVHELLRDVRFNFDCRRDRKAFLFCRWFVNQANQQGACACDRHDMIDIHILQRSASPHFSHCQVEAP